MKIANAKNYVRLQPLGWGAGTSLNFADETSFSKVTMSEFRVMSSQLPLAVTEDQKAEEVIQELSINAETPQPKKDFFEKFVSMADQVFNFPIYGIGIQTFAAKKMYFYSKAVRTAAHRMASEKPIIIPVLSAFNESEMSTVYKTFGKAPGFEAATETERRHQRTLHLMTPEEFANEKSFLPGHQYFIFVGAVPQSVFNFIYEVANLPVWVAGKNAMSFAETKGKPYFNTVDDYQLPGQKEITENAKRKSKRAFEAFDKGYNEFANPTRLTAISQFIEEASTANTELNNYYKNLGEKLSKTDKVTKAIQALASKNKIRCENIL
ncbi:MAG: hypothetical protein EOP06_25810 [Proteobacteria bacterium]|nr:MAG: hypothetical protein EOP06_25810 [Pseudomonadota bacterium]